MAKAGGLLEPGDLPKLRRALRRWHARHGRDLPWRNIGDPYRVWISEIMLQQTTVTAVVPYYERFLARFPDITALAAADEEQVLRLWEGLGYYSRARNIHRAARRIVGELGGNFPQSVDELTALPGIGRYTAGAIASFAFDRPAPIVEANTLRLYCRLLGYDGDPRSGEGQRLLWEFAGQLVPRKSPGEFNQALMDLGAGVCTPAEPGCPRCPLRTLCRAFADDRVAEIPRPASRAAITEVVEASVAVHRRGAYLLRRRGEHERWAGLWDFLRFELADGVPGEAHLPPQALRQLAEAIGESCGLQVALPEPRSVIRHAVTRYRITLHCLQAQQQRGRLRRNGQPLEWVAPAEFDRYPLSVTGRKFAQLLARQK
jgi:A/G-specific adenine glycosylase